MKKFFFLFAKKKQTSRIDHSFLFWMQNCVNTFLNSNARNKKTKENKIKISFILLITMSQVYSIKNREFLLSAKLKAFVFLQTLNIYIDKFNGFFYV